MDPGPTRRPDCSPTRPGWWLPAAGLAGVAVVLLNGGFVYALGGPYPVAYGLWVAGAAVLVAAGAAGYRGYRRRQRR